MALFVTVEYKKSEWKSGWEIIREYFEMPADNFTILFDTIRRELNDPDAELRVWFERTNPNEQTQ